MVWITMCSPNDDYYVGEYQNSKKHGEGIYIFKADGVMRERRKYLNGKLQESTLLSLNDSLILNKGNG